jgi:hypothetical protein
VPPDEEADPVHIGVLRAKAIVQIARLLANLVQEASGLEDRVRARWHWSWGCMNNQCRSLVSGEQASSLVRTKEGIVAEMKTIDQVSAALAKGAGVRGSRAGLTRALIPQPKANPVRDQELAAPSTAGLSSPCGVSGRDPRSTLR